MRKRVRFLFLQIQKRLPVKEKVYTVKNIIFCESKAAYPAACGNSGSQKLRRQKGDFYA